MTTIINGSSPSITFSDGSAQTSATRPFLNRIINGAMVIDQRNAGASVTITNTSDYTYTLDRWGVYGSQASKFSVQQNAGSVTPPVGFTKYLGVTSLSAYSILSTDRFEMLQGIEGVNTADLGWGTASASTVTVSFWVRSSLTGTFGGSVQNSAGNRSYPFSFTISSANTWEQKSITIAGDTTGTWVTNTTAAGIYLNFSLGVGSNRSGTANTWAAANYTSATGATSVVGTSGATFYLTGVQLEVGSTATSFDYRPYGTEFDLCRRYTEVFSGSFEQDNMCPQMIVQTDISNRPETRLIYYPKRASPSVTITNGSAFNYQTMANTNIAITGFNGTSVGTSVTSAILFFTTASGVTTNSLSGIGYISFNGTLNSIVISAEL